MKTSDNEWSFWLIFLFFEAENLPLCTLEGLFNIDDDLEETVEITSRVKHLRKKINRKKQESR